MDEVYLSTLINKIPRLKYKFGGIFPADKFPVMLPSNTFVIVNSENSTSSGQHWMVWSRIKDVYVFADPLALDIYIHYPNISQRILTTGSLMKIEQILNSGPPLQSQGSNLCGLYCIYIAHFLFSGYYSNIFYISETELLRFIKHLL